MIYSYEKYYKHLQMTTVQIILSDYRLYNNVHEKITRVWSAENECKVETGVQVTNSARTLPKFMSVFTFCDVFSCSLKGSNNMISHAIWCNKHL